MRRHLRYRLMAIMLILVLAVTVFVGVTLFSNVALSYNREFYQDMADLQEWVVFFNVNEGNSEDLADFLATQDSVNPLLTDRGYCIYRDYALIYSNSSAGIPESENLFAVLDGEENREATIFDELLDFAWTLPESEYTLYVVDYRNELNQSMRNYLGLFIQALLLGIALAVGLSFLLARQFTIPIQNLTRSARTMQQTNAFDKIPIKSPDEIGELTRVFNEMGVRITKNIQMLQDLLRSIPKPLFAVNEKGVIVHSNAAFNLLFDESFSPAPFTEGHREDPRFMLELNGRYYLVYRSLFLLENGSEGTLFLLDDVTEAEQLENERRQFVADVSHELKTPLTVIKSYSETILESELDAETSRRFLKVIERSADQMNATVSQLLEMSKSEAAESGPREPLDLVAALNEVLEAMSLEFSKKELKLQVDTPAERPLLCVPDQLRRVMLNLLSNSVKYSNPGGTVTVSIKEREGGVAFSVRDEGIGIAKEHLPHLFEKFYRVDKARSRQTGGTGLGLSIVHAIVTGMGGEVTVESALGEGSTFTCYFPD